MRNIILFCLFFLTVPAMANAEPLELNLENYRGSVVYLDFWASWCKPCKESFPWMISLQDKYADDGLVVITVSLDRNSKSAEIFLTKLKSDLAVVYDPDGELAEKYKLEAMPTSFIYDRTGNLVGSHIGFNSKESKIIEQELIDLLQEKNEDN
jgi:thiol-disulfide isomerase/thioredoxin